MSESPGVSVSPAMSSNTGETNDTPASITGAAAADTSSTSSDTDTDTDIQRDFFFLR